MAVAETFAVCGVAGLVGALAMDEPMALMPEGFTPAYVTASRLRGRTVD
jgi:hypothetical protein